MPVSGLIVTFSHDPLLRSRAIGAMREHSCIEVGEIQGERVPITVETEDSEHDREVWAWLHEQPGIAFVDLVCVHCLGDDERSNVGQEVQDERV